MNTLTKHNAPVICGVEITTDEEGRFNLNALHKASGGQADHKKPSEWLRTKQAQELISELSGNSHLGQEVVKVTKGGTSPGTFAHELLAISYAGWISPAFQLQVNQTFLDYRTGRLAKPDISSITRKDIAYLLIASEEENERLRLENDQMKPDAQALQRIAKSDGCVCITDAAKDLQMRPKDLFSYLSAHRWIYRRPGGKSWLAYQNKIQTGVLMHKVHVVTQNDGTEKMREQVLVTPKGLTALSRLQGD